MKNFIFVGIGASAGGLQALQKLVANLPKTLNYVYIIAQHLDPNKKSSLSEILSRYTPMRVQELTTKTKFQANHIYIVPSGHNLIHKNNRLTLQSVPKQPHPPTPSVDKLFEALALYKKQDCIGIVLTGAGDDGSQGVQVIKEYSGITIAQSPQEAQCKSMPQNAINTQKIDYILTLEEIAKELADTLYIKLPTPFKKIQKLLQKKQNISIKKYKNETILRRMNKRMLLLNIETLDEYLQYIKKNPQELEILHQSILIGVTQFFRDKSAFEALRHHLYLYLKEKPDNYEMRIWSIACSTGEEPYSFAILVDQISKELQKNIDLHIFATDIDEIALNRARAGIFSANAVEELDKEILQEYFEPMEKAYKVSERIRKQIIFTRHNILNDPPFINQDFISCRNLLIYLLTDTQQEIFALFHYILKENGLLFLGSSESTLISSHYFESLDAQHKIYIKEQLENPPKISSHYFTKHLEGKSTTQKAPVTKQSAENIEDSLKELIYDICSSDFIVIDTAYNIVYKKGSLPFLQLPDGFMSLNILDNLHKSLRYDVSRTIKKVLHSKNMQTTNFVELSLEKNEKIFVRVIITPLKKLPNRSLIVLYFQQLHAQDLQFNTNALNLPDESFIIKNLTTQLAQIQEDYQQLSDELLETKENMQLLNEELQSSNEELQSSNEELETANEELQSSNEELHLSILNEQKLQQQLSTILNATQDGIIGLDIDGNHTFVNNAALKILGFSRNELIGHNAHKLWHHTKEDGSPYIIKDCTLHNHLLEKKSIRTNDLFWKKDGTPIHVEVLQNPIIQNGTAVGAVLSFHDISEKIELQKKAEHEHRLAELYMNITGTLVMLLDLEGNIALINQEGANILGLPIHDLIGKNWFDNFISKENLQEVKNVFTSIIKGENALHQHHKNKIIDANKQEHLIAWTNSYIKDINGNITGIITSGIDITKEEVLSKKLFEQEHIYKLTFEEADVGIAHISLDGNWMETNEYMTYLLGYSKEEFKKMSVAEVTFKEDIQTDKIMLQELLEQNKNSYHVEKRYIHKNGSVIWVSLSVVLLRDEEKTPLYFLKIIRDITQLKMLMYQLEQEKEHLKKIIDFTPIPVLLYNEDGEILLVNKTFTAASGYSQEELPTIETLVTHLFGHLPLKEQIKIRKYYKNPTASKEEEQTIITKNNEKRIGILHAVSFQESGTLSKKLYLIAIVDITDLQKKDEFMIAQSRQAAMGDMLAIIAHQWRQPLSIISMLANNIRVQKELGHEIKEDDLNHLITTLNEQTAYLSHTIDDFRDFFKPEKAKETITIENIIQKILSLVEKSLKNNNITLQYDIEDNISITTYPNQLIQVLINIINNAKDAIKTTREDEKGLISITAKQTKKQTLITVCDNGGGIDASVIHKLGQPYVTTKSKHGTGLGLYMSIIIVSKHLGGKLHWENTKEGCCFSITLKNSQTP